MQSIQQLRQRARFRGRGITSSSFLHQCGHAAGRTIEEKATKSGGSLDEQIRELTVSVIGSEPLQLPTNTLSPAPFNILEVTTINADITTLSYTETFIKINDDALRKELNELAGKIWHGEISFGLGPISAKRLYHFMARLIEHRKCEDGHSSVSCALQVLVYWATSFNSTIEAKVEEMQSTMAAEFEYLWALFEPGKIMVIENFRGMKGLTACVSLVGVEELTDDDTRKLRLTVQTIDTASGKYGYHKQIFTIRSFVGKEHVCDLGLYPLSYHKDSQELEKRLVSRGREFIQLTSGDCFHYQQYEGKVFLDGSDVTSDWEGKRIMVDCALNKIRSSSVVPKITRGRGNSWLDPDKLTDEELLICSGTVPAITMSGGTMGAAAIDCLRPVEWRDISVAKNVGLADDTKAKMEIVMQVAKAGFGHQQSTVILFHGDGNSGKKWTVEVIAEELRRPNFIILPFSHPQSSPMEWTYEFCNRWGAIMHVQEPINAMLDRGRHVPPAHFIGLECLVDDLRTLKGVVCFMTTSHAKWIQPELWPSVTFGVEFKKARAKGVTLIWSNVVAKAGVELSDKEIQSLAQEMDKISQINSVVKLALGLAESEGSKPGLEHFERARDMRKEFLEGTEVGQEMNHYT
ncbi:hypothetical protein FOQG_18174 [Fusarium oxysporum f. sp. raphani 54005]|uniref:DUF7025 domain-containing protein n=4 Tax=Fusarium oxysporum TaxID=5507 RepID=X0B5R7_FUSOX|nr:hypothetical protein FOQG_18174 [Fusarium oxysporum f. sp. raphani 54005]KAG7408930.1 hypothetical protein Forpi1262_v017965 [Fusarium oxysporum f. sp. raphani]KAI8411553.1 hypothetical protein FOFC_08147 [Fusarium oxysporum]